MCRVRRLQLQKSPLAKMLAALLFFLSASSPALPTQPAHASRSICDHEFLTPTGLRLARSSSPGSSVYLNQVEAPHLEHSSVLQDGTRFGVSEVVPTTKNTKAKEDTSASLAASSSESMPESLLLEGLGSGDRSSDLLGMMSDESFADRDLVFRDPAVQWEFERFTTEGISPAPTKAGAEGAVTRKLRGSANVTPLSSARVSDSLLKVQSSCVKDSRRPICALQGNKLLDAACAGAPQRDNKRIGAQDKQSVNTSEGTTRARQKSDSKPTATSKKWSTWLSAANQFVQPPPAATSEVPIPGCATR